MLSIATDYAADTGNPEPYLRGIAAAGFSHLHWCHHWNTDFLYSQSEIDQIKAWLAELGLKLLDLHASAGVEKAWASTREYERLAGVELVKNRIEMAARLGGDAIVMHFPRRESGSAEANSPAWAQLHKSLAALEPFARQHQVRIALENGFEDDFVDIRQLFAEYDPAFLGLCYDSGHGNLGDQGLDHLESVKDRLLCIHLHDNDGNSDQHRLPFSGTVDWPRLTRIIAASAYSKCLNLEVGIHNSGIEDETAFLEKAFAAGTALTQMITHPESRSQ